MFITLDGARASGKSTQAAILSEKLGLPTYGLTGFSIGIELIANEIVPASSQRYSSLFSTIIPVYAMPVHCITESLWRGFDRYITLPKHELDRIITVFRTSISLGERNEPNLSVFLSAPISVTAQREINRDLACVDVDVKAGIIDEHSKKTFEFWKYIEQTVPYFHVINANMPVDAVTHSIVSLFE